MLSTIDVIAQEEVVGLGRESTVLEQPQQIVILSVNVTANLDGSLELQKDGLSDEDFTRFCAQKLDFIFRQVDWFAWSVSTN